LKTEAEISLGTPRHRWENNIRMDLREIRRESVYWILLVHNRNRWWALVNTIINLQIL
jgi:hypothetical protein